MRHGEAEHNVDSLRVAGQANDSELTTEGIDQAEDAVEAFKNIKINVIYHSPAIRCVDTAKIMAKNLPGRVKLVEDERLLEMHQGNAAGKLKVLIILNPMIFFRVISKRMNFSFTDGESFNDVANRMTKAINDIEEKNALVVTHGFAIRCYLARKFKWPVWKLILSDIKNAQILGLGHAPKTGK